VIYDADCGVCVWLMGKVLAWDRRMRIRPVALDAPEAEPLLRDLGCSAATDAADSSFAGTMASFRRAYRERRPSTRSW